MPASLILMLFIQCLHFSRPLTRRTLTSVLPCLIVITGSPLAHPSKFLVFAFKLADAGKVAFGLYPEFGVFLRGCHKTLLEFNLSFESKGQLRL